MRSLKLWYRRLLETLHRKTNDPPPDQRSTIRMLNEKLMELATRENAARASYMERCAELLEASQMCGAGPWTIAPAALSRVDRIVEDAIERFSNPVPRMALQEAAPIGSRGDVELMLQNIEWRREVNLSWMEFSRWGIQQIILISRLYYVKNPIIRRLIDVCAAYVFARGVEVTVSNDAGNAVLRDFFERNKITLGQNALCNLERAKDYDGNIFFVLFADTQDKGLVDCRTIDATEMQEIVTNPEDQDTPWYYRRLWSQRVFDPATGQFRNSTNEVWYPALGYDPVDKPAMIGGKPVAWNSPVLHRKCGGVAKWHFGCPRMYPALDWAKESRRYLEACASVKQALAQIGMTITTKGGQQALEGIKQQMQTTVGPGSSSIWDANPPSVAGSTFASGPGTKLEAFLSRGAGADPEEVRQYKLMCCMVAGVPETFLGDVSTGNLATATSLDRPTETVFLEKQESWREDLVTIAKFVLRTSKGAPGGRLRETGNGNGVAVTIRECARIIAPNGRRVYEAFSKEPDVLEVRCNFPAIREGDIPQLVNATVEAMMPGTGEGIDAKAGARKLYDLLGIENGDELTEEQYPEASYDPDRTKEPASAEPALSDPALREGVRAALRRLRQPVVENAPHTR